MTMESELILSILNPVCGRKDPIQFQNNKWSIQKRFEQGTYVISCPPYGYINDGGEMRIVLKEAEVVRRIFNDTINGKGSSQIASEMCGKGLRAKRVRNGIPQPFGVCSGTKNIQGMQSFKRHLPMTVLQGIPTTERNSSITAEIITNQLSAMRLQIWQNRKPDESQ